MNDQADDLRELLSDPSERLDLELKDWFDPDEPDGQAKIARACIAMRNNNGGRLAVGFRDDGKRSTAGRPADPRTAFNADKVQAIASRYSSEPFAVDVTFVEFDGVPHPVICVPPGFTSPVAAKSDLLVNGKPLVRDHTVYVRSINSNNRPTERLRELHPE